MKMKSSYVMMGVNLKQKKMLIIGGGPVAYKRYAQWRGRGAQIKIVATLFCDAFSETTDAELHLRSFQVEDLDHIDVVYIATENGTLNDEIEKLCRIKSIWCGRADSAEPEIQSVAMIERGMIQIGVSTGGKSPAITAKLKEIIESAIDLESLERQIDMMQELKNRLKRDVPSQAARAQLLKNAVNLKLEDLECLLKDETRYAQFKG